MTPEYAIEKEANDKIVEYLKIWEKKESELSKLLCVGNERNGQVSLPIVPNMENLNPDTDKGTKVAIWIIRANIVQTIIKLVFVCEKRYISFESEHNNNDNNNENHFQVLAKYQDMLSYDNFENHDALNLNDSNTLEELYNALKYVWSLPLIQTTFKVNNNYNPNYKYNYKFSHYYGFDHNLYTNGEHVPFWIPDNMEHYLYDLKRIFSSKYIPSPHDIKKCKRICIKIEDYDRYSII